MGRKEVVRLARVRRMVSDGTARRIREEAGLSIPELASAVNVSRGAIHHWESGRRIPRDSATALRYGALLDALDKAREQAGATP